MNHTPKFISFEGTEGVGKTTAIEHFCQLLTDKGIDFVRTREPGGSQVAERIRELFLARDVVMCDDTELLLMFAARADHVQSVILPALSAGKWVVCDRFVDSTVAYQGFGRFGGDRQVLDKIDYLTRQFVPRMPDLTLWLDLDIATGIQRAGRRGEADRLEAQAIEFFEKVHQGLAHQHQHAQGRIIRVDADGTMAQVADRIAQAVFGKSVGDR